MKILIVDESVTVRRIIMNQLHEIGHEDCAEANNATQGLQMLLDGGFNVVILDWNLVEGMSSSEFIRRMDETPATSTLPVVIVTTTSEALAALKVIRAVPTGVLIKPFTAESLNLILGGTQSKAPSSS